MRPYKKFLQKHLKARPPWLNRSTAQTKRREKGGVLSGGRRARCAGVIHQNYSNAKMIRKQSPRANGFIIERARAPAHIPRFTSNEGTRLLGIKIFHMSYTGLFGKHIIYNIKLGNQFLAPAPNNPYVSRRHEETYLKFIGRVYGILLIQLIKEILCYMYSIELCM